MTQVPFCLQRHNAYKAGIHFDLRIKYPNKRMLISFAIPKAKFPKGLGERSIAIKVNDHNMSWLTKDELRIPRGEYGGGFIKTVQKGNANIIMWTDKQIVFEVNGEIADGRYYLINTQRSKNTKTHESEVWILLQKKESE